MIIDILNNILNDMLIDIASKDSPLVSSSYLLPPLINIVKEYYEDGDYVDMMIIKYASEGDLMELKKYLDKPITLLFAGVPGSVRLAPALLLFCALPQMTLDGVR